MEAPREVYRLIGETHLPNLTDEEHQVLAATVIGLSVEEIALRVPRSSRTIRLVVGKLEDLVCAPAGIEGRRPAALGLWFARHCACSKRCAGRALEMIESNSIFTSGSTS